MGAACEQRPSPQGPTLSEQFGCATVHQNIQNEEPQTHLSSKIGRQFNRPITASKNIMQIQIRTQHGLVVTENKSLPVEQRSPLLKKQEKPSQQQLCAVAPVCAVLGRVKVKRPSFHMISIDPKKFLKGKGQSIYSDYQLTKEIGKGGFGSVYRAKQIKTGAWRAVKKIPKKSLSNQEKALLANEFEMLCRLDHPNIVKLYDIYDDAKTLYVVTELCEGGDLLRFVNSRRVSEEVMRSVMVQVLSALKYMHSFRILHRDIKLENIVLVDSVNDGERINVKIIDFGISLALSSLPQEEQPQGTLLYMSPESLDRQITLETDIWSCGIALYMMATRSSPYKYKSEGDLMRQIRKCKIDRHNLQKLSLDLKVFIMQLLEPDPKLRCSASKAINSSWLKRSHQNSSLTMSARARAAKSLLDYDAKNNLVSMIEGYLIYKRVGQDQRQRLASIFQQIDVDNSGIIEIDQLKKFYSENSEYYQVQQVQDLLSVMDKNKSGKIDFNEFITAMCDKRLLFQRQALEEAFEYFDRDGSGEISRQELEEILEGVQMEEIEYLFREVDKNEDRKISRKEFMAYLSKHQ